MYLIIITSSHWIYSTFFHYFTRSCFRTHNIEINSFLLGKEAQANTNRNPGVMCHKIYLKKIKYSCSTHLYFFWMLYPVLLQKQHKRIARYLEKKWPRITITLGALIYKEICGLYLKKTKGRHHVRLQMYSRLQTEELIHWIFNE